MKEESTKMKDQVFLAKSTAFSNAEIPCKELPPSRLWDIRVYKERPWVMLFMERQSWEEFAELCRQRGLDPKKVMYGTFIKIRDQLRSEKKC